jgi:hypothetical protein
MTMYERTWAEMFPEGREIFYEGDNPNAFANEIKEKYGFDPSENNPNWNECSGFNFLCPAKHLDAIYGSRSYPMGS